MGNRDRKKDKFKSSSMLKSEANKSEEIRIRQVSTFYHSRVLRHVKAYLQLSHMIFINFAVNSCVTIASGFNML